MHERTLIKCDKSEHYVELSQADKNLLSLLGERLSAEKLQVLQSVFLRSFKNRAGVLARTDLVDAVGEVVRALEQDGEALSYMYSYTVKQGPLASTGSGAVSGIRMPGDDSSYYSLRAGLGVCKLERRGTDEDGSGLVIEVIDCRDRTELATENCGVITIKRRKVELALQAQFKDLHFKLVGQDCAELLLSYEEHRFVTEARS
jgi:hypothetical protein